MSADPDPLVVTVVLDEPAQGWLDDLRRRHFPPERNHLAAHLTAFHALPAERVREVEADLAAAARDLPLPVVVAGVRSLGRGVALEVEGDGLVALRARLAGAWEPWLGRQDRQGWRPHVTVQNKVEPAAARALLADLRAGFVPVPAHATALALWRYRGGPWEPVARHPADSDGPVRSG